MSASDAAAFMRRTQPRAFADIRCAPDRASGWDYVCTYTDPMLGREKMGVLGSGRAADPAGAGTAPWAKPAAAAPALRVTRNETELLDYGQRVGQLELGEQSRLSGIHPPDDEKAQVRMFLRSLAGLQRQISTLRYALIRRKTADVLAAERDLKAARARDRK